MLLALLLTFAAVDPGNLVLEETCDCVELNHFYDDDGRHVFDQVIFYAWDGRRHQVLDWRLVKEPSLRPQRLWSAREERWQCLWADGQNRDQLRRVLASSFRETWTQFDPELAEREFLPKEDRRLLRRAKVLALPAPSPPGP